MNTELIDERTEVYRKWYESKGFQNIVITTQVDFDNEVIWWDVYATMNGIRKVHPHISRAVFLKWRGDE